MPPANARMRSRANWIKPGRSKITINERTIEVYFARPVLRMLIQQPARRDRTVPASTTSSARCRAADCRARRSAVRHGLSKALMAFEPDLRAALKRGGFLTRDARVVERKKYGKAKARRSFQFSKR